MPDVDGKGLRGGRGKSGLPLELPGHDFSLLVSAVEIKKTLVRHLKILFVSLQLDFAIQKLGRQGLEVVVFGEASDELRLKYPEVIFLGHIPNDDRAPLYSGAECLVYASLYEGFGLPILEAFACGTPVVTSNLSSTGEVAGGAAVLVDPNDVNSIKEGIESVLRGPKAYIEKGYRRVKDFSWEKTAQMTLDEYNEFKQ